jgi:pyruvate,water dikinase
MPPAPLKIMMNVANPERALDFAMLPNAGVGLARLEMIIASHIGVHPKALIEYGPAGSRDQARIDERIAGYSDPVQFYVDRLAEGIATITAAFAPNPVIVRLSDFKSNEYANLIGGKRYEPHEENPMIGFRGASRYVDPSFKDCFALECRAMRKVREEMGLENAWAMIPFVRTVGRRQGRAARDGGVRPRAGQARAQGDHDVRGPLERAARGRVPRRVRRLLDRLERPDPAHAGARPRLRDRGAPVRRARPGGEEDAVHGDPGRQAQGQVHRHLRPGPSDHPDLAEWLMDQGIESVSLNPDTVVETWLRLAKHRKK